MPPPKFNSLSECFESLVVSKDDCWIFQRIDDNGYGKFQFRGKRYYAHRAAWELYCGEIPQGLNVLHDCDNPPCCNPEHLFLGTKADNMQDCINKGRNRNVRGVESGNAILNDELVRQIRERAKNKYVSYRDIAIEFGIDATTVIQICKRLRWAHVS